MLENAGMLRGLEYSNTDALCETLTLWERTRQGLRPRHGGEPSVDQLPWDVGQLIMSYRSLVFSSINYALSQMSSFPVLGRQRQEITQAQGSGPARAIQRPHVKVSKRVAKNVHNNRLFLLGTCAQ